MMNVIRKDSRGPDVAEWQAILIKQGLLEGSADGIFGDKTDAATRSFQARENLTVDGVVGR